MEPSFWGTNGLQMIRSKTSSPETSTSTMKSDQLYFKSRNRHTARLSAHIPAAALARIPAGSVKIRDLPKLLILPSGDGFYHS